MVANDYNSRKNAIIFLARKREENEKARYGITHTDIANHLDITPAYARQFTSRLTKEGHLIRAPWQSPTGEAIYALPTSKHLKHKTAIIAAGDSVLRIGDDVETTESFLRDVLKNPRDYYASTLLDDNTEDLPEFSWAMKRVIALLGYEIFYNEKNIQDIREAPISKNKRQEYLRQLEADMHTYRIIAEFIESALKNPDVRKGPQ